MVVLEILNFNGYLKSDQASQAKNQLLRKLINKEEPRIIIFNECQSEECAHSLRTKGFQLFRFDSKDSFNLLAVYRMIRTNAQSGLEQNSAKCDEVKGDEVNLSCSYRGTKFELSYLLINSNFLEPKMQRSRLDRLIKEKHQKLGVKHIIISDLSIIQPGGTSKLQYLVWDWASFDQIYDRLFNQDLVLQQSELDQLNPCLINNSYSIIFNIGLNDEDQNADVTGISADSDTESDCIIS